MRFLPPIAPTHQSFAALSARAALAALAVLSVTGLGCDEQIRMRNLAPEITLEGLCTADGHTYIQLAAQDLEENAVDVDLRFTTPGQTGQDAPALVVGPRQDGRFGLLTSRDFPGRHHFIEWAPCGDAEATPDTEMQRGECVARIAADAEELDAVRFVGVPADGAPADLRLDATFTDSRDKVTTVRGVAIEALGECDFALAAHE